MKRYRVLSGVLAILACVVMGYASGRVSSEVKNNVAYVYHDDAWWNCCPDTVFEIKQDGYTIDIYENDLGTHPCNCMCYFDFTHTLEGLEPGTYLARVWEGWKGDYDLAGTTSFTILGKVGSFQTATLMSECQEDPGVGEESSPARGLELENVSSSPARKSVGIRYHLPVQTEVALDIYDVIGTRVRELNVGAQEAGDHLVVWDIRSDAGQPVPRGIYFVRLKASGESRSLKLIVLR